MKRIGVRVFTAAACISAATPFAAPGVDQAASPIFGVKIPPGYRDWGVISLTSPGVVYEGSSDPGF